MNDVPWSERHARTKIVATVGPACNGVEKLCELLRAGVSVFRINTAHGTLEERAQKLADIRVAAEKVGRPVGVLVDLAGPKIRLGELFQDPTTCDAGAEFRFVRGARSTAPDELTASYPTLVDELNVGGTVMLADGTVSMTVVKKTADEVRCRVTGAGLIRSRQGINLPGAKLSTSSLTPDDLQNATWAAQNGVDFVSLSFVRKAVDVLLLKELLRTHNSKAMTIAKIEKPEALAQLREIVAAAEGVMVARGDLGVEIDVAEIAVVQKRIIAECQKQGRPVIVATQMLDSMHHSRRPTRAEATDVANAILDGADACMLSGETAIGEFPVEAVAMMNRIMLATEPLLADGRLTRMAVPPAELEPAAHSKTAATPSAAEILGVHPVTAAAVVGSAAMAHELAARLIVVVTRGGGTCRLRSKQRDFIPTVGVSDSEAVLRRLSLFWGVLPLAGAPVHDGPALRAFIDQWGRAQGLLKKGDRVLYVTGTDFYPMAHNIVVIHEVD